jgi:hypothetical protein
MKAVEVLDRYLQAVSSWLPNRQQADIVAELGEDLRSEIEERERELGRSLAEADVCAILERRGHPMWVAEAFLPKRYLIGPTVLPFYWRALKVALACVVTVLVLLYVVFAKVLENAPPALAHPGFWIWQLGLWAFAYVGLFTMIFALVERSQSRARAAGHWDPRDPHALPSPPVDPVTRQRQELRVSAIVEAVVDLLVLGWWLDVHPPAMPELGIVLTPVWQSLHWPIAALLAASAAVALANAFRPSWSRPRLVARLMVDGFGLALAVWLLTASPWVRVTAPAIPPEAAAMLEKWLNLAWLTGLLGVALVCAGGVVQNGRRLAGKEPIRFPRLPLLAGKRA